MSLGVYRVQLSRTVVNLSDFSLSKQTPTSTQCDGEHTETGAEGGSENSSQVRISVTDFK